MSDGQPGSSDKVGWGSIRHTLGEICKGRDFSKHYFDFIAGCQKVVFVVVVVCILRVVGLQCPFPKTVG